MAEYIDRDKALEILENSLKYVEDELLFTHEEYRKGCIASIKDDIGNISHIPTEDVLPRSEVERLTKELLDKDIEMENEVHRLEAYIEQIEKEAEDWESVAVNREAKINKLQSILLQFTDIVHKWGAKHNFDTTEISLVPILEQEANSIIDQAKQEVAREIFEEIKQKRQEYWDTGKYTMFECWCKAEEYVIKKHIGEKGE